MEKSSRSVANISRARNAAGDIQLACNVPQVLDTNLEVYCLQNHLSKKQALVKALEELLRGAGMDPHKQPRISFQYDQEA